MTAQHHYETMTSDAPPHNATKSIITITQATTPNDILTAKSLFTSYATWLNLDLTFQSFASELSSLPGPYAPPSGCLLLARDNSSLSTSPTTPITNTSTDDEVAKGEVLGCIAIRPLPLPLAHPNSPSSPPKTCEMKRFFVTPTGRGKGIGAALIKRACDEARGMGYATVKLDTLPEKMGRAVELYTRLGFVECERYYDTPIQGTLFLEKDLRG